MKKLLDTFEKYNMWIIFSLLGLWLVFEFINRIGIIDDCGFALATAHIITIFILAILIISMIVAVIYHKKNYLKVTGLGLLGYYIFNKMLSFPTILAFLSSDDWSKIVGGVFALISVILLLLVTAFYLISIFFDKYHFLNKFSIILLLLNFASSLIAFLMFITSNAFNDAKWYEYFSNTVIYLIAPLLSFSGILYLFSQVDALGTDGVGEVVGIIEDQE